MSGVLEEKPRAFGIPYSTIVVKKQMRKLQNIFKEYDIKDVDVLFIDVEGFEIHVINGINFDEVSIECVCVENGHFNEKSYALRHLLNKNDYKLKAHIGGEEIYIKRKKT
jgi:hypothetical protein